MEMVDSGSARPFHSTFPPQSTAKHHINPILALRAQGPGVIQEESQRDFAFPPASRRLIWRGNIQPDITAVQSMSGVSTIDSGEPSDFLWDDSPLVNRIILQAQALKDALSELDWWGPVLILEMATSGSPTMRMTSKGDQGTCTMELSGGCECFDDTSCTEDTCEEYRFSLLQGVLKALHFADKACLRVNRNGMLSVQVGSSSRPLCNAL